MVEREESYYYLKENRLFIDFFSFQIGSVEGILVVGHNCTLNDQTLKNPVCCVFKFRALVRCFIMSLMTYL